jgi:integrase
VSELYNYKVFLRFIGKTCSFSPERRRFTGAKKGEKTLFGKAPMKLTKTTLKGLKAPDPSGRPKLHFDDDLKGFAVLCSGKTAVRSYVVQRDLPGGKSRRITIGAVNELTIDQARAEAATTLHQLRLGVDPKAERRAKAGQDITLRAAFEEFLAKRELRPKTRSNYVESLKHLESWFDRPLRTIDRDAVESRHKAVATEIAARRKGSTGTISANCAMRVLRLIWNDAAERHALPGKNPVMLKRQWFAEPRREGHVSAKDLAKFWAGVQGLSNDVARDYLTLLLFTGLRRGESSRLRWIDIDFVEKTIRVPAASTKAGRTLALPMSDVVHAMLVTRRSLGRTEYVFPSVGRTGHIAEPKFPLAAVARTTGVRVSAHDLRRSFITVAESTDMSVLALKAIVNHALPKDDVTSGYVMLTPDRLAAPVQKIADKLKVLCGIVPPAGENIMKFS